MKRLLGDLRQMVGEQVEYRELLYQVTMRDLMLRYKQTVMGFGWAIFMPLVNTVVFSVIFMRIAPIDTGGVPYPLFAYSGLLAWNFLASSLRFSVNSLTSNVNLVTKVYFPREILPLSAVIVSLVDAAVAAVVLVAMMAYYQVAPGPALLFLPVVVAVNLAFVAGVALVLAVANLFYRDVKYLFEIVLTVWMFSTSVVYPIDRVGGRLRQVLELNPMTPIIEAYRAVVLRGAAPGRDFWAAAAVSFVVLLLSWLVFHRSELEFAENV